MQQTTGRWSVCVCLAAVLGLLAAGGTAARVPAPVPPPASVDAWEAFTTLRGQRVPDAPSARSLRRATVVAQDARGRLWVGDHAGVTRVDGDVLHRWQGNRTPGMRQGHVLAMYALANGDMLLGLDQEGLLLWSLQRDQFTPVRQGNGKPLTRVNALRQARDGGVWVASDLGLFHWQGQGAHLGAPAASIDGQAQVRQRILDVHERPDGSLWLALPQGLYRRAPGGGAFERVRTGVPALDLRLAAEPAGVMASDPSGNLWVGLSRSGIVVIPPAGPAWAPDGLDGEHRSGGHPGQAIEALLWQGGRMWAAGEGGGLLVVEGRTARRQSLAVDDDGSGPDVLIRDLMPGPDGRIWAASDQGLFHFDPDPRLVREIGATGPDGLPLAPPGSVRSVFVDRHNRLWLGMGRGVVQVLDPGDGSRRVIQLPAPLRNGDVAAMAGDGRGRVWVAGHGVMWLDESTLQPRPAGALSDGNALRILSLAVGPDRVWLGHQDGLLEVDLAGKMQRSLGVRDAGLRSPRVHSLAWHDGRLWAGTAGGLYEVDLQRWSVHETVLPVEGGTGAPLVGSLLATGTGVLAGHSHGVSRVPYDSRQPPEPLLVQPGREVRGLADDGNGGIWITQEHGIAHRDRHGRLRTLGPRQGLSPAAEPQRGSAVVTRDGGLVAAAGAGAVRVDGAFTTAGALPIPDLRPHLVAVRVNGRLLPHGQMPAPDRVWVLDPDVEQLVMTFSADDHVAAGQRRYSYRLAGLDSDWVDVIDNAPVMFYSRLPAGRYTLVMRTSSDEFPGQEWITELPLEVRPDWYAQASVQFLAAVVMILMGWGGLQLRNLGLRRNQLLLERTIDQRTCELRMANERLDRLAGEDSLTGLYNRRRMFDRLGELHARRQRVGGADVLVMLDLDHFKRINDRHGHLAGDAVLREVARRIRNSLRSCDMAARFGGEELLVVLTDTSLTEAAGVVERLLVQLSATPVAYGNLWIPVQGSFGVALLDPQRPLEDSLARADEALYRAKALGRNRMCVDA